ncbi:ATP-binding cassette sub-family G member 8-like [Sycon ciliatum]|uniref:ATP-binding cassette sub-family G member 8-like n=1 Tax=Sycon ciliatum TaxID=27933 RepID=UPI0031F6FA02
MSSRPTSPTGSISEQPGRRFRPVSLSCSLSEEETYSRLVEHGRQELLNAQVKGNGRSGSRITQVPEDGLLPSSTPSPPPVSNPSALSRSVSSVIVKDSLWMAALEDAAYKSPYQSSSNLHAEPHGQAQSSPGHARPSCLPLRRVSSQVSPPTSHPAEQPSSPAPFNLEVYDSSPSAPRRDFRALGATSPSSPGGGDRVGKQSIGKGHEGVSVTAQEQRRARKPQRIRRLSSILNSFTCDLVATDIEYEVPIPQPSALSRLTSSAAQRTREAAARLGSCCCSREGEYDVTQSSVEDGPGFSDPESATEQEPRARLASISSTTSGEDGGKWRKILHGISFEAQPGKMIAILGGSGSGKTSFLDVLSGRSPPDCKVSGKLTINGSVVHSGSEELKFCVGYVTQQIFLLPMLTVEETLCFVALLRLPKKLSHQEKLMQVSQVLGYLGLEPLAQRLVGGEELKGLSGGQQRLVAIATQMIYNPGVLILDEPTSGLDSYTAEHVCKTLHELAMQRSRAIVLTIHQPGPEITQLFDHVLILSSGHTIYNGAADRLVRYFNSLGYTLPEFTNPCDYYVDLATIDTRSSVREQHSRSCFDFLVNAYTDFTQDLWSLDDESDDEGDEEERTTTGGSTPGSGTFNLSRWIPAMTPMHPSRRQIASFASSHQIHRRRTQFLSIATLPKMVPTRPESVNSFVKFGILLRRTVKNELRDSTELLHQAFHAALLSLLFGLVFIQLGMEPADLRNRKAILFISFTLYPFMAVFETIAKYAGQQMMVFHEMVNGLYTSTPFGVAKILGELPASLLLSAVYSIPLYFMSSLRLEAYAYFRFLLLVILLLQIARMMALAAGVITQSPNYAALTANLLFTGWILTAGYIININNLWPGIQWVAYISPIRYAFQAASITELEGRVFSDCPAATGTLMNATSHTVMQRMTSAITTAPTSCNQPLSGDSDLTDLGFDLLTYRECVAIMLGMYAGFVAIVLTAMRIRSTSRPE